MIPPGYPTAHTVEEDLASAVDVRNAHRVLTRDGMVAPGLRAPSGDGSRDVHDLLRSEGVQFDGSLRADPAQRLTATDLAILVGLTPGRWVPEITVGGIDRSESFLRQLAERQSLVVQAGVMELLRFWCELQDAFLDYGPGRETTCYLQLAGPPGAGYDYRPFTVYPSGWVEVSFKWLLNKPPFDSARYRDEFRRKCNEAPGVGLPAARLDKLPSFKIQVLTDQASREALFEALKWFVAAVDERTATRA